MAESEVQSQDDITKYLRADDELGTVLRCHNFIEAKLYKVIEPFILDNISFRKANFTYEQIVLLAVSLGLNNDMLPCLNCFGTIRNKFAHDNGTKLTKNMMDSLYKSFPTEDREIMNNIFNKIRRNGDNPTLKLKLNDNDFKDRFSIYVMTLNAKLSRAVIEANEINNR